MKLNEDFKSKILSKYNFFSFLFNIPLWILIPSLCILFHLSSKSLKNKNNFKEKNVSFETSISDNKKIDNNFEFKKVTLEQAVLFMQQRCKSVNQTLMRYKSIKYNGTTLYVFLSVSQEGLVCISSVSEYKLEVLSADCGNVNLKIEQWNAL